MRVHVSFFINFAQQGLPEFMLLYSKIQRDIMNPSLQAHNDVWHGTSRRLHVFKHNHPFVKHRSRSLILDIVKVASIGQHLTCNLHLFRYRSWTRHNDVKRLKPRKRFISSLFFSGNYTILLCILCASVSSRTGDDKTLLVYQ